MPFYTYILRCSDGTYYVGHTDNLDARMAQHGDGVASGYTARRRPLELVWAADFQTRANAFELERQLKGWSRAKKEALMRGDFEALPGLARSRTARPSLHRAHPEPVEGCNGTKAGFDKLSLSAGRRRRGGRRPHPLRSP